MIGNYLLRILLELGNKQTYYLALTRSIVMKSNNETLYKNNRKQISTKFSKTSNRWRLKTKSDIKESKADSRNRLSLRGEVCSGLKIIQIKM